MKTRYKRLSPENQQLWNTMKYLYMNNPDKYHITKTYDCYDYRQNIYVHEIKLMEKTGLNPIYWVQIQPTIELRAKEIFPGYIEL